MKVLYVQDMDPMVSGGGAQLTDKNIICEGIRRGYDVSIFTPISSEAGDDYDLAVFSNCVIFPHEVLAKIARKPYVFFIHDYYQCRYRLFYPLEDKCRICAYMDPWRKLYANSALNIFMSPLHKDAHFYVMPELADHPYALVPSAIKPEEYMTKDIGSKPNTVLGVNCLLEFKGKANVLKYVDEHPELYFTIVGGLEGTLTLPQNCQYLGVKNREDLVKLYAESEYLVHLPQSPSPFDRVVVEYLLANPKGKLITNRLVGALSWPNVVQDSKVNREELIRLVSKSAEMFWDNVGKLVIKGN